MYQLYDDTQVNHQQEISMYAVEELSPEEIDGLILMREEEKLARDVYLELYDIWGQQIFLNIANSESTHTNAVKLLLDKYNLTDPVTGDTRGVFTNQDLNELYASLVETGSTSLLDSLIVGATVEDLDIYDLQRLNEISDNQDITAVYDNLEKGSRNHLRSFTKVIETMVGHTSHSTSVNQSISKLYLVIWKQVLDMVHREIYRPSLGKVTNIKAPARH